MRRPVWADSTRFPNLLNPSEFSSSLSVSSNLSRALSILFVLLTTGYLWHDRVLWPSHLVLCSAVKPEAPYKSLLYACRSARVEPSEDDVVWFDYLDVVYHSILFPALYLHRYGLLIFSILPMAAMGVRGWMKVEM